MQNTSKFFQDVLVVGGGVSGVAAAVITARRGLRTMLIDSAQSVGGLVTNGYVNGIAGTKEGIILEWMDRLAEDGALIDVLHQSCVDPEKGKLVLERMLIESGVRVLYGVVMTDAISESGVIKGVTCHSKSGNIEIYAKIVIDGTGDGDVAAYAGAPYEVGSPYFAGLNMSTTLAFRMANVNLVKYGDAVKEWRENAGRDKLTEKYSLFQVLEEKAAAAGDLPFVIFPTALIYQIPGTEREDADISVMCAHSFYTRNLDAEDVSRQILEQHNQILWLEKFMNKYVSGFEKARLTCIANMHGIRDTRRILGEYVLTDADVACGSRFNDGIARFPEFFDTHHPTSRRLGFVRHVHIPEPKGTAVCREPQCSNDMHVFGRPAGIEARVNPKGFCDIPYRSLVPKDVENLLVVGRAVSAEFNAQAAVRVIATCMSIGQAAGEAAAICLKEGISPRALDGSLVRKTLIETGVPLDRPLTGHWEKVEALEGDSVVLAGDFIAYRQKDGTIVTAF